MLVILCTLIEEWWTLNEWKVQSPNTSETSVSRALPQVFSTTLEHIRSRTLRHNHEWCFECEPSGPDYSVTMWIETEEYRMHMNNILTKKEIKLIKKVKVSSLDVWRQLSDHVSLKSLSIVSAINQEWSWSFYIPYACIQPRDWNATELFFEWTTLFGRFVFRR